MPPKGETARPFQSKLADEQAKHEFIEILDGVLRRLEARKRDQQQAAVVVQQTENERILVPASTRIP